MSAAAATACSPSGAPKRDKKPALQSVGIALGVLEALAVAPELSLSELARRVGVAKSTAHRTCSVLTDAGMLTRTDAGKYRLGLRLIELGHLATSRDVGRCPRAPAAGRSSTRARRDRPDRGSRRWRRRLRRAGRGQPGAAVRLRQHPAWPGPPVELRQGARGLRARGARRAAQGRAPPEHRLHDRRARRLARSELDKIRERGYARSVDETEIGMSSIAVPGAVVARRAGRRRDLDGRTDPAGHRRHRVEQCDDAARPASRKPHRAPRARRLPPASSPPDQLTRRAVAGESLRLRHRRRRVRRLRTRQPAERRSVERGAGARGRSDRLEVGRLHPHAGGADLPDRQPLLRLEVRVRTRAAHGRSARATTPGARCSVGRRRSTG